MNGKQKDIIITEKAEDEGQEAVRIETDSAVYFYHKKGGGFSSLIDEGGTDWINYHPGGGSAGEYRGIPNLGDVFHPGYINAKTEIAGAADAPRIESVSEDGEWACAWDFYPDRAVCTVTKIAGPYWFLYEGTPGGVLDTERDYWMSSDGETHPLSDDWVGVLPDPEWACFASTRTGRSLALIHHEYDDKKDQYWPMENNMTVFGFGRQYKCCERYIDRVPARFTIALLPSIDRIYVKERIAAMLLA